MRKPVDDGESSMEDDDDNTVPMYLKLTLSRKSKMKPSRRRPSLACDSINDDCDQPSPDPYNKRETRMLQLSNLGHNESRNEYERKRGQRISIGDIMQSQ